MNIKKIFFPIGILTLAIILNVTLLFADEYQELPYKYNGKQLLYNEALGRMNQNNICLENENNEIDCFIKCSYTFFEDGSFSFYMFPNETEFICIAEGSDFKYYNLSTRHQVNIGNDIEKYLNQFTTSKSETALQESLFAPFENNRFSLDLTKYVLKIEDLGVGTGNGYSQTNALCVIDLNKLSIGDHDYFDCPILTDNLDINLKKVNNLWIGSDEVHFVKWLDNEKIEVKDILQTVDTPDGKKSVSQQYTLNMENNVIEKSGVENKELFEPPFKDIDYDYLILNKILKAYYLGFISGYPDGSFKPNKSVNRAEFAKMLMIAFGKGEGKKSSLKKFFDVYSDQWYVPYLSRSVELGVMGGYPDGTMKPGSTIIKAEALKMVLEAAGSSVRSAQPEEQWYEKYRKYAKENFDLDFVSPDDMGKQMTRGECVELILEAM